jgi:hypothetical protein
MGGEEITGVFTVLFNWRMWGFGLAVVFGDPEFDGVIGLQVGPLCFWLNRKEYWENGLLPMGVE